MNAFPNSVQEAPSRGRVVLAFAAVYLLWGATYLAIKWGIETIPPFLLAGGRHMIAGVLLYVWVRSQGTEQPTRAQWGAAAALGALMLFGGNGGVTWAVQRVPSGIAAVIIALMPMWMAVLDWLRPGGVRPSGRVVVGLLMGFAGIVLLVGPERLAGGERVDPIGAGVLVLASLSWAAGSLLSRHVSVPRALLMGIAMQSIAGGALLWLAAWPAGDWARLEPAAVSSKSVLSLGFLVVFGSVIGLSSYIWLLRVVSAARVATYAYVNPAVALFLGWLLGGEALAARSLLATVVILAAVALIVSSREEQAMPAPVPEIEGESTDLGCAAHVTKPSLATETQRTPS